MIIDSYYTGERWKLFNDLNLIKFAKIVNTPLEELTCLIFVSTDHYHTIKVAIFQTFFIKPLESFESLVSWNPEFNKQQVVLIFNSHFFDNKLIIREFSLNGSVKVNNLILS
jgi:hypothetical protein